MMPASVQIVVAILGVILILLGLVATPIKIFGAEVGPLSSGALRHRVLFGGVLALIIAFVVPVQSGEKPASAPPVAPLVNNNQVFINNNTQPQASPKPADEKPAVSYSGIWACIPPLYRPDDPDFEKAKPAQRELIAGLLTTTFMGQLGCVKTLVDAGADIDGYRFPKAGNITDGPPLHLALRGMHWDVALFLLEKGANPNLPTHDGTSAHDEACANEAPEYVIQKLNGKGAQVLKYGKCKGDPR